MNGKELKEKHKELAEKQPFTKKEQIQFDKKDQSMIRNIQILNGINKKDAIAVIKAYKSTPKQTLRRLARAYRKRLQKYSSPVKPDVAGSIKAPKKIKGGAGGKKGASHQKKQDSRSSSIFQENHKKTKSYLENPKNKNQANYTKIEKASKKYIDASPYELRYGVNSKKSQAYREKNGLSPKYTGRVIK